MSHPTPDSDPLSELEIQERIDELAELFFQQLLAGESPAVDTLVAKHPELGPSLARRLGLVRSLFRASLSKPSTDAKNSGADEGQALDEAPSMMTVSVEQVHHIRCPHCGNRLDIVTPVLLKELTCGSCGSAVNLGENLSNTTEIQPPLRSLGRFQIRSIVGRGGFGVVYRAWDDSLNRDVAIKIPRAGSFSTENDRLTFLREAKNAGKLNHPGIVRLYDVAESGNICYIVSEYVDGITLSDLAGARLLSHRETAERLVEVCEAIEYAHREGIIHRDIKPSNILIDRTGRARVCDFGLAISSDPEISLTLDGEVLGTPAYMSPEQATGKSTLLDERSDVFSLGVVLYRLLSGELPFRGSRRMMLHQVVHDDPRPLRLINDGIPIDLETIAMKAMAKESTRRYQSAQELGDDLRRWLRNEPIKARRISTATRLAKWCRRRPVVASLSIALSSLILVATTLSVAWAVRETHFRQTAQQNAAEINRRLVQLQMENGFRELVSNRWLDAVHWLSSAQALSLEKQPSLDRLRLGLILDQSPRLLQVWDAESEVVAAEFVRGQQYVLVATKTGRVVLFDAGSGRMRAQVELGEPIYRLQVSDKANRFVVETLTAARLHDLSNLSAVNVWSHEQQITSIRFSDDGTQLISTGGRNEARIVNSQDGSLDRQLDVPMGPTVRAAFLGQGQVATVSRLPESTTHQVAVWDLESGQILMSYEHADYIGQLLFDLDTQRLYTGDNQGVVRIADLNERQLLGEPLPHRSEIRQLAIESNPARLLAFDFEGQLTVWDLDTQRRLSVVQTESNMVATDLESSRRFWVMISGDSYVRVAERNSGRLLTSLLPQGTTATYARLDETGRRLLTGGTSGVVQLWDLAGMAPDAAILDHDARVTQIRFSPDDYLVATASADGTAKLWRRSGGQLEAIVQHDHEVLDLDFSHQGTYLATVSADQTARVWDTFDGRPITEPLLHDSVVHRVDWSRDSDRFVTATLEGVARIWQLGTEQPLATLDHGGEIRSIRISPNGQLLVTCGWDHIVRFWDVATGSQLRQPFEAEGPVTYCQFSPSGQWLVAAARDHRAILFSTTGDIEAVQDLPSEGRVTCASFSPDEQTIITTDYQGVLNVWWQAPSGEYEKRESLEFPNYMLFHADLHPTLPIVAVCGSRSGEAVEPGQGAIFLWDYARGQPLAPPLNHMGSVRRVRFNAQGDQLASASSDGTGRIWELSSLEGPIDDVVALGQVLSGKRIGDQGKLEPLTGKEQQETFDRLKASAPEWFRCTDRDVTRWTQWLDQFTPPPEQREE